MISWYRNGIEGLLEEQQRNKIKANREKVAVTAKKSTRKVNARIDMSPDIAGRGLCPECRKPMTPVIANGFHCLCCMEDRIVLPVPNKA